MRALRFAPLFALAALAVGLVAACSDDAGGSSPLADSFIRLGEGLQTESTSWVGALPDDLDSALNPGLDADDDDRAALPVHPDGELIGSTRMRGADGERTYFLTYEVPADDRAVEATLLQQLDESPWQLTGGQSNEQVSAVQFSSTTSGDILGTAVIQPLVTDDSLALRLRADDGSERTVTIPRAAPLPLFPFRIDESQDRVFVRAVDDQGRALGIEVDDQVLRIGTVEVESLADVSAALAAVRTAEDPRTSIVYILQVAPPIAPTELPFVLPQTRELPSAFPADFLISDEMIVLTQQWSEDPGIAVFTATLLSPASSNDVLDGLRDALDAEADWLITDDRAVGFATQIDFGDTAEESVGSLSVDAFPDDPALTLIVLQVQVVR